MALCTCIVALASSACGWPRAEPAEPIPAFWAWFDANRSRLPGDGPERAALFESLSERLERVDKYLDFEFGPADGGGRVFFVSAGGMKEAIPAVRAVVAAAPPMEGWQVIAFKRAKPGFTRVSMDGRSVDAKDIRFVHELDGSKVHVDIYVEGLEEDESQLQRFVFILLDGLVGEFQVMTRIGGISILPLAKAPGHARPLTELPAIVDRLP